MNKVQQALVRAQRAVGTIVKNKVNDRFGNTYADLQKVQTTADPVLHENGLTYFWNLNVPVESGKSALMTTFWLTDGTEEQYIIWYPLPDNVDPQKFAAAITYAKRKSLTLALNIIEEDDDGETAVGRATTETKPEWKQEAAKYVVGKPGTDAVGTKKITWGKYKDKTFQEVGKQKLEGYAQYLRTLSSNEGKPVSKNVLELETLLKQWNPNGETDAQIPW